MVLRLSGHRREVHGLMRSALEYEHNCDHSGTKCSPSALFQKSVCIGHTSNVWSPSSVQIPPISSPITCLMRSFKGWNSKDTGVSRPQRGKEPTTDPESFQTGFSPWDVVYSITRLNRVQKRKGEHPQMESRRSVRKDEFWGCGQG